MGKVGKGAFLTLALIFAASLAVVAPAEACHRYSHWAYPWPQKCGAETDPVPVAEKPRVAKRENRFKTSHIIVPTVPAGASDSPSAADLDRLRAALNRKLEGALKQ